MGERYPEEIKFSIEAEKIINMFKCLTVEQYLEFFPEEPEFLRTHAMGAVHFTATNKRTLYLHNQEIIINSNFNTYDQECIDCLWVTLDFFKKSKEKYGSVLCHRKCQHADEPFKFTFFVDNIIYKLIYINKKEDMYKVSLAQQIFYANNEGKRGKESSSFTRLVFVSRNNDILDWFDDANIVVPHIITVLDGEPKKKPEIAKYELEN